MIICKSYVNDKFTEAHISYWMGYVNTAYVMLFFHIFLKDLLLYKLPEVPNIDYFPIPLIWLWLILRELFDIILNWLNTVSNVPKWQRW